MAGIVRKADERRSIVEAIASLDSIARVDDRLRPATPLRRDLGQEDDVPRKRPSRFELTVLAGAAAAAFLAVAALTLAALTSVWTG